MRASLTAELLKVGKRPATWLIAAAWLVLSLLFGYLFPYLSYRGAPAGPAAGAGQASAEQVLAEALPANLVPTAIQGFPVFAGALALLLGALSAGSEYGWGTWKTILAQGPGRLAVLAGKLAALGLVLGLVVLATFAVAAPASWLIAAVESQSLRWPPLAELAQGLAAGWLVVGMWGWAGMFLGILVRGTSLAIGLGLVWTLAVENLVRGFASLLAAIEVLQRFMPGTNAGSVAAAVGVPVQGAPGGTLGVTTTVDGTRATLVLAAYLVAFTAAAAVLLQRRDVT
jgi:ABC-2 type transport system permease protein